MKPQTFRLLAGTLGIMLFSFTGNSIAQVEDSVTASFVTKLDQGQTEAVKEELPNLIAKYQNSPGILYLQGRTASDGIEAAKLYQSIIDNYPRSQWADDALYELHQYYYAMGLYKTAELKMQQLKKEYPESPFLTGKKSGPPPESIKEADIIKPTPESVSAVPPRPAEKTPQKSAKPYTVQTGAFSTADNAAKQKLFFEDRGYNVEISNKVREGRSLYLVWVGSFDTAEEARTALQEIKTRYKISPIVVGR